MPPRLKADKALSLTQGGYADVVTFLPQTRFYTQIAIKAFFPRGPQSTCVFSPLGLKVSMAPCPHRILNGTEHK